jgi:hypothetical protein
MSATVTEKSTATLGADALGKKWHSAGMTWLRVVGDRVAYEMDYHDRGAIQASLGVR